MISCNEQDKLAQTSVFYFRTQALKDLWDNELSGQISDGMWENTNNTGWAFWCTIRTEIGEKTYIDGKVPFNIKRNFAFDKLFKYIGDRIMKIINKYEPDTTEKQVRSYMKEISNAMKTAA